MNDCDRENGQSSREPCRVLILGGGFGGIYTSAFHFGAASSNRTSHWRGLNAVLRDQVPWNPELAAIARDLPSPFTAASGAVIMGSTICTP